jgi:hypothetical protein
MERADAAKGKAESLEEAVRMLWSAYAYLRDTDLRHLSRTSRLLHEADVSYLCSRLRDELLELAGVLAGEHRHGTRPEDVVLEGSQVCYWAYLAALALDISYDRLRPHEQLASGEETEVPTGALAEQIRSLAQRFISPEDRALVALLAQALQSVGIGCGVCGLDAREVVTYDLQQMAARDYMSDYFASLASGKG